MEIKNWIINVGLSGLFVVVVVWILSKLLSLIIYCYKNRKSYRRKIVRRKLDKLFDNNGRVYENYGPKIDNDIDFDKSDEIVDLWLAQVKEIIIPNNDEILSLLKSNMDLMQHNEKELLELFEAHVHGFKSRHLHGTLHAPIFPSEIIDILR